VLQLQAEQPVVGAKHRQPQPVGKAEGDPLVAAAAQRGRRAGLVGDAAVAAAEDQDLNELVEDDPVGDAAAVAAERVVDLAGGSRAANWTHRGSRMDDGRAGMSPPRDHGGVSAR
jgi:hypothetical protein